MIRVTQSGSAAFSINILRSAESYSQKWNYVRENPVRARLVGSADAWPYAGEIAVIYHD
jgi:putative transposase